MRHLALKAQTDQRDDNRAAMNRVAHPQVSRPVPWFAYGCLATGMSLVGLYVGLSKPLAAVFPVFLLAWLRFGIAAVAMAPWLRKPGDEQPFTRHDQLLLFLGSLLGNFLFSICMLLGVQASSAMTAGIVMAGIPAAVALLSRLFLGETLHGRLKVAIVLAVAGVAWLALSRTGPVSETHETPWWAYALLLGAVFCEASYVVIGKGLSGHVSPKRISALINLWGLALMTPLGLWQAWSYDFSMPKAAHWVLLVFYAMAASIWTVVLWMRGMQEVPANRGGVFTMFLPLSSALVGWLWLGEALGATQLTAFALALGSLLLATWPARPST